MTNHSNRVQRAYDHRLRNFVHDTGDSSHATRIGVPRSTASGWIKRDKKTVVSLKSHDHDIEKLECEVVRLRSQVAKLRAIVRLLFVVLKLSGFTWERFGVPNGAKKLQFLNSIGKAATEVPLRAILAFLRLSHSRYHAWNQSETCSLNDRNSCPRTTPSRLTTGEIDTIRELVFAKEYRHLNTVALARLAQRLGKVFASPTSWYRMVRIHDWKRPRNRIYPPKPKVGIRAAKPNEIWHIDTSIVRLLDGRRAYLHAIIDNFSRRILAWCVGGTFDPAVTATLLQQAAKGLLTDFVPQVYMDSGVENTNSAVTALVESGTLKRILAQVDVVFSNSMIEAWWRMLKHQWLYLNELDSVETVRKLVAFYVEQHNSHVPHSAFKGWQTPDEIYFSMGAEVPEQLKLARVVARQARRESNLAQRCSACTPETELVPIDPMRTDTT